MREFGSLAAFAAHLTTLTVAVDHAEHVALDEASKLVMDEAKSLPGHPQAGWPALAPSTVAKKTQPADSILLETGELVASYERTVGHHEAQVGSNSDKAVWHELGTSRMPPRPVLVKAATNKEGEVRKILGDRAYAALIGKAVP